MKKVVGYVIAIAGLIIMAVGLGTIPVPAVSAFPSTMIVIAGVAGIVVGVVISLTDKGFKRGKQAREEVPIYEGEGKNRKIVGYQRR